MSDSTKRPPDEPELSPSRELEEWLNALPVEEDIPAGETVVIFYPTRPGTTKPDLPNQGSPL